jgi:site-specific DNA-methyltransferase (adenine-specific)
MIDLRLGRWEDVLADVERVDAVICDPPYSERTHKGHDAGPEGRRCDGANVRALDFAAWAPGDAEHLIDQWALRCSGWWCVLTDHLLAPAFADNLTDAGLYVFAPLPCVSFGSRVRLAGDGPSCWATQLVVARPRHKPYSTWGTLPGAYVFRPERGMLVAGGKPLALMRAIIRDYTRPGDLVCDPCAGGGTTLLAAAIEGRRAIGAEMDPETHAKATERLAAGYTPDMFAPRPEPIRGEQGDLL